VSDARWADVESDVVAVTLHFGNAIELYARGGFDIENQLERYARRYALLHANAVWAYFRRGDDAALPNGAARSSRGDGLERATAALLSIPGILIPAVDGALRLFDHLKNG
jgi:hypothetical protein